MDNPNTNTLTDYGSWIEALRDVDHLSDAQLSRIGQIVGHRLRYRSTFYLAEMIEHASRDLRQQLENDIDYTKEVSDDTETPSTKDSPAWQICHSARFILEDANPEKLAEACGLPLGVIVAAFEIILPKETDTYKP